MKSGVLFPHGHPTVRYNFRRSLWRTGRALGLVVVALTVAVGSACGPRGISTVGEPSAIAPPVTDSLAIPKLRYREAFPLETVPNVVGDPRDYVAALALLVLEQDRFRREVLAGYVYYGYPLYRAFLDGRGTAQQAATVDSLVDGLRYYPPFAEQSEATAGSLRKVIHALPAEAARLDWFNAVDAEDWEPLAPLPTHQSAILEMTTMNVITKGNRSLRADWPALIRHTGEDSTIMRLMGIEGSINKTLRRTVRGDSTTVWSAQVMGANGGYEEETLYWYFKIFDPRRDYAARVSNPIGQPR